MSKLFNLKKWLTVEDTAHRLSIVFDEDVTKADVLRLALDGHLKMSVQLVNKTYARPLVEVNIKEVEWDELPSLDGRGKITIAKRGPLFEDESGKTFQILKVISELGTDVWDIVLAGGGRLDIEHLYQMETGGPPVTDINLDGDVILEGLTGNQFQLQSHFADNPYKKSSLEKPWSNFDNFYPACGLPEDSVLVVRTSAVRAFETKIIEPSTKPESTRKTENLLKAFAAIAMDDYGYDPKSSKSSAPKDISDALAKLGHSLDPKTIRSWLKEGADLLEPSPKTN